MYTRMYTGSYPDYCQIPQLPAQMYTHEAQMYTQTPQMYTDVHQMYTQMYINLAS